MSLFHSLKKTITAKAAARPDVDFQDAKTRFDQYDMTVIKMKGNISNYLAHATGLYVCSTQIAQDFTTLLENEQQTEASDHSATVQTMRQEHSTLASEQVPILNMAFRDQITSVLDTEISRNNEIKKRIAQRMQLFEEVGYYVNKVQELKEEREKRAGKGKPESASDIDKHDRNQIKMGEVEQQYSQVNSKLMEDLAQLWATDRIKTIAPVMHAFIAQEKNIAQVYAEMLSLIKTY